MANQEDESLTTSVETAARILGISRNLCYRMIHEGRIPHLAFGKRIVVPRVGLMRLLAGEDTAIEERTPGGSSTG